MSWNANASAANLLLPNDTLTGDAAAAIAANFAAIGTKLAAVNIQANTPASGTLNVAAFNTTGGIQSSGLTVTAGQLDMGAMSIGAVSSITPSLVPSITGSRGGNAALASLLTFLANFGLIQNNTSS